jgi:hypothetical protein
MYGVEASLRLKAFHGLLLQAVDFLESIVYFRFARSLDADPAELEIGVEGRWEIQAASGLVVAGQQVSHAEAPPPTALFPIGDHVVSSRVDPPHSFGLVFASGRVLVVFDSNASLESFSIPQLNVYV